MKLITLACITATMFSLAHTCSAQDVVASGCAAKNYGGPAAKPTVASPAEDNYDIKYLKFDLSLSNDTTFIKGNVFTSAKVVGLSLPTYVFELDGALTVDSAFVNGIPHPITSFGSVRTVTLPAPLPRNTMFTAQVYYHGTPIVTSASVDGINCRRSTSWNSSITFTHSEPFGAREWWPCKQSLRDKIDSVDMWLTVADSLKAGSNGVLKAITPIDATHVRYEWAERYPIDYYLISAAVSTYTDYSYYMHFSGSADSMLVQNYIYSNPAFLSTWKKNLDSTGLMIDYFSTLFGRYPFWKEKYGHCMAPLGGAMEHQTMTTTGYLNSYIVAHELVHQWFGDNVTCGSWSDIFVNEGITSYGEYLFYDHFHSHAVAINDMKGRQEYVNGSRNGAIFVDDTTRTSRILNSRLSYDKGACALHMLRYVINNDSSFFRVLRTYQQQFRDGNASIMDFKGIVIDLLGRYVNGINIDEFFDQWFYKEGFPIYSFEWNQSGPNVYLQISQVSSTPASVPLFTMPIDIKVRSAAGDTIIHFINDQPVQNISFAWNKPVSAIVPDPESWLLDSVKSINRNLALSDVPVYVPAISIHPNPASESWAVGNLPQNSTLALTDLSGRLLWHTRNEQNTAVVVPAGQYAAGLYLLKVANGVAATTTYKLVKN